LTGEMLKRAILPLALVAAIFTSPLSSGAAPLGATLTYGRITVHVCVDRTPECAKTSFSMVGTYVIAGKVYAGQIVGIADSSYSTELDRAIVAPFALTGVSSLGALFLECDGLVLPEPVFRMTCFGNVMNGGSGYRTVVVKGTVTDGPANDKQIQGNYRGVA
jgi:hypothetical protein